MEFNQNVSNPLLVGAMELVIAEDTPEHRKLFLGEMVNAKLLAPVDITPTPECNEAGELQVTPGSQLQFPMLSTKDGKYFLMAFTDKMELDKWKEKENPNTVTFAFGDYAGMLLGKDKQGNSSIAQGFVINPFGANMVITKEMVIGLVAAREAVRMEQAIAPDKGNLHRPE